MTKLNGESFDELRKHMKHSRPSFDVNTFPESRMKIIRQFRYVLMGEVGSNGSCCRVCGHVIVWVVFTHNVLISYLWVFNVGRMIRVGSRSIAGISARNSSLGNTLVSQVQWSILFILGRGDEQVSNVKDINKD